MSMKLTVRLGMLLNEAQLVCSRSVDSHGKAAHLFAGIAAHFEQTAWS
jgi:hypothetical protein